MMKRFIWNKKTHKYNIPVTLTGHIISNSLRKRSLGPKISCALKRQLLIETECKAREKESTFYQRDTASYYTYC